MENRDAYDPALYQLSAHDIDQWNRETIHNLNENGMTPEFATGVIDYMGRISGSRRNISDPQALLSALETMRFWSAIIRSRDGRGVLMLEKPPFIGTYKTPYKRIIK